MQKQSSKGFFKKGVMKNFGEFTKKYVSESLFCSFLKNETLTQVFSCEFFEICKNNFLQNTSRRLLLVTAISIVSVMKGELASKTVNYDAKSMYQFEPQV